MNKDHLIKIIKKHLEKKYHKKIDTIEWDSLAHLNILIELDEISKNKVSKIKKITEANTFLKLLKLLSKSGVVKND